MFSCEQLWYRSEAGKLYRIWTRGLDQPTARHDDLVTVPIFDDAPRNSCFGVRGAFCECDDWKD